MKNLKLIIVLAFLLACGFYQNAFASETYKIDGNYVFYTSNVRYDTDMPPLTYYPDIINYTNTVHQNITFQGDTTYQLNEKIVCNSLNELYLGSTYLSGTRNAGLDSYTQEYVYLNSNADFYSLHFNLNQKRGGSGWVDIYGYYNSNWVKVISETYSTSYSSGDIIPDSKIQGWKIVCHYDLSNRFYMVRTDDLYADGYLLNEFGFIVKDSQQQEEDTQKSIEENTRQTNGILGTIQNKIDGVTNKIQSVIDGITNLPDLIMDGLKDLLIPDDFTELITDNVDDLTDSLGVLGFPLRFVNDCVTTITNNDSMQLEVSVPTIGSPWGTLFPGYHRQNILYFVSIKCFTNVGINTQFSSLLTLFGLNYNSSIVSVVHAFTNLSLFFVLLRFLISKYNDIFDTDIDVGGDEE